MLVEFTYKNVYSYDQEAYFSLETGSKIRKYQATHTFNIAKQKLLKSAVIFGANASGKSNLIKAMLLLKNLVIDSNTEIDAQLEFHPFLLQANPQETNSEFCITFVAKKTVYRYTLVYNNVCVDYEKLEYKQANKFVTYFERNGNQVTGLGALEKYQDSLRGNVLFLYFAQSLNDAHAIEAYRWFKDDLIVFDNQISPGLMQCLEDETKKQLFLKFLRAADIQIEDVIIRKEKEFIPLELQEIVKKKSFEVSRLYLKHKRSFDGQLVEFGLGNESAGTIKMMLLALTILKGLNTNKVILIDELDDSFHLELTKSVLDLFNSKANNNQFIVTTHELQLMDEKLRKDQIYFVQKDATGNSELYSMFDFDDEALKRSDISYMKRYIKGQFGALPLIDQEGFLDILGDDGNGA